MSAHYSFRVDRTRGLVRIAMGGFFGHDDIAGFREARRKAHRALGWAPNAHVTLGDLRGMKVQAPDIVEAFRALLGESDYRSRRLAFILGETLLQGQARRALAGREGEARCFTDPIAAEAWLLAAGREEARRLAPGGVPTGFVACSSFPPEAGIGTSPDRRLDYFVRPYRC